MSDTYLFDVMVRVGTVILEVADTLDISYLEATEIVHRCAEHAFQDISHVENTEKWIAEALEKVS